MQADFKSPYKKATGAGSNRAGLSHWVAQKFTAVANVVLTLFFFLALLGGDFDSRVSAIAFFRHPVNCGLTAFMIGSVFYHAKLGLTMVAEDYISCKAGLVGALTAVNLLCYGGAAICLVSLISLL